MTTKNKIIFARELIHNFQAFLAVCAMTVIAYGIIHNILEPPKNPPIEKEVLARINEQRGAPVILTGLAFKTQSKYDEGMPFSYIVEDRINEWRSNRFKEDVKEKTLSAFFIILIGFIGGRYLLMGLKWILRTSKLKY